jgi:hypothetical protein
MPDIINGDPDTVSSALVRTITNATNATPIVCTTSAPHGFSTDDTVINSGIGGNTAANGEFQITVVSPTTFQLNGSVGSGAYTAGGQSVNVSLTPAFEVPADDDDFDAASMKVGLETLADRTQHLMKRIRQLTFKSFIAPCQGPFFESNALTISPFAGVFTPAATHVQTTPSALQITAVSTAAAEAWAYSFPLDLPHGAELIEIRAVFKGAGGHGALPLSMPKFGVVRYGNLTLVPVSLLSGSGLVTDSSASVAAYEAIHEIVYTPDQNTLIDRALYSYGLNFMGEGHTNAVANFILLGFKLKYTR